MTLTIETVSHGEVAGGFLSVYTSAFRFGEFAFPTQALHNTLRYLAKNPQARATNIPSFSEDTFYDQFSMHLDELGNMMAEISNSFLPELAKDEVERFITKEQGRTDTSKIEKISMVPVRVSDDEKRVSFGKYRLDRTNFRDLVAYALEGGWFGWNKGEHPESAIRAKQAVLSSTRPIYIGIKKMIAIPDQ